MSILKLCRIFGVLIVVSCVESDKKNDVKGNEKRSLIWPEGPVAKVQAIMGAGFPVDLEDETVIIGIVIKSIHIVPQNASEYTNPNIIYARKRRSISPPAISRWDIYRALEQYTKMYGLGGKECVLRAICELSETPIDKSTGIIEEIMHTIFTPTTTNEILDSHSDNEYYAAQKMGKKIKGGCGAYFPGCGGSLVDMFSAILRK